MRPIMQLAFVAILTSLCAFAASQDTPPLPPPPDVPATPVDANSVSILMNVTTELHFTDAVRMEAVAVRILTTKHGLTTAAAKALLRPLGELDLPRCAAYIILARLAVETDGFRAAASGVVLRPVVAPAEGQP